MELLTIKSWTKAHINTKTTSKYADIGIFSGYNRKSADSQFAILFSARDNASSTVEQSDFGVGGGI